MSAEAGPSTIAQNLRLLGNSQLVAPLILKTANPESKDAGILHFDRHFNPELGTESAYFKSLQNFMNCVERNIERDLTAAQQEQVCANEYKQLRLKTFDGQLLYHNVNKKFFQKELSLFRHETAN